MIDDRDENGTRLLWMGVCFILGTLVFCLVLLWIMYLQIQRVG